MGSLPILSTIYVGTCQLGNWEFESIRFNRRTWWKTVPWLCLVPYKSEINLMHVIRFPVWTTASIDGMIRLISLDSKHNFGKAVLIHGPIVVSMNALVPPILRRSLIGCRRSFACSCSSHRPISFSNREIRYHRYVRSAFFSSDRNTQDGVDKSFADIASLTRDDLKLAWNEVNGDNADKSVSSDIPGSEKGGKKLAIIYTCKVCNTRSAKKFTEQAYKNGLVMIRCPGCQNLHLIADRLGVFDDSSGGWDIQKYLESMGEKVKSVTNDNVLEVTLSDIVGPDIAKISKENK